MVPEVDVEQELHHLKLELFEKYQCKAALKSPAHITLIPPFNWANHQSHLIIEYFQKFKTNAKTIEITIDGFDKFGTQVVYAKPLYNSDLEQLQNEIFRYFELILKDKIKYKFTFNPHITIANRDLKAQYIPEILEKLNHKRYTRISTLNEITLFKHDGIKWQIASKIFI